MVVGYVPPEQQFCEDVNKDPWLKKNVVEEGRPSWVPTSLQFDMLTATQIARVSSAAVSSCELYNPNRERCANGPLDLRFGPSERGILCKECNQTIMDCPGCPGHFGYVALHLPLFHPGFMKHILQIAQSICKCCGRLLLPEASPVSISVNPDGEVANPAGFVANPANGFDTPSGSPDGSPGESSSSSGPAKKRQKTGGVMTSGGSSSSTAQPKKQEDSEDCVTASSKAAKVISRKKFTAQMLAAIRKNDPLLRNAVVKRVVDSCKKIRHCPHCFSFNGSVKKTSGIPLAFKHERFGNVKLREYPPDNFLLADSIKQARAETTNPALWEDLFAARRTSMKNARVSAAAQAAALAKQEISQSPATGRGKKDVESAFLDGEASNLNLLAANVQEDLTPLVLLGLFRNLTPKDCLLLDVENPTALFLTSQPVPPGPIRPTVNMMNTTNDDDLTHQVGKIWFADSNLRADMASGSPAVHIYDLWRELNGESARMLNSNIAGLPEASKNARGQDKKPIRSIAGRLKGKEGRFRCNLMGKRVDFSGRTVISPDPNVEIDEVVIPEHVAKRITFPERVTALNYKELQMCIINGHERHPGASDIQKMGITTTPDFKGHGQQKAIAAVPTRLDWDLSKGKNGKMASLSLMGPRIPLGNLPKAVRLRKAQELQIGDIVNRHMNKGDICLFNRQPSLHRMSIMAHKVVVHPWRTFRFNECVCGPYNADFDGDEMNIHLPQTQEARAEAYHLMGVKPGILSPRNGEPAIACTQDFLTASFLSTQKTAVFTRSQVCQMLCHANKGLTKMTLPPPTIVRPIELWTGKVVFSMLLRSSLDDRNVLVNTQVLEKAYSNQGKHFCHKDGYVEFNDSELISGALGKKTLGDGAKKGLFAKLFFDVTKEVAARMMGRVSRFSSRWLSEYGFTIGIDDVMPHPVVMARKAQVTKEKMESIDHHIKQYNDGTLTLKPGCSAEMTLEALTNADLGAIRSETGKACTKDLGLDNKVSVMATCGSKGSDINLCQMMACLGQQNVMGGRIRDGFVNRTLPVFKLHTKEPKAKGFVANSFYSGLEASEFFMHTMAGREGLVDSAVKTAETGYMQRRLIKALEDLAVKYDNSVRTSDGRVIQFVYGADGLNPGAMEDKDRPLDLEHVWHHVLRVTGGPSAQKQRNILGGLTEHERKTLPAERLDILSPISFPEVPDEDYVNRLFVPEEVRAYSEQMIDVCVAWMRRIIVASEEFDTEAFRVELKTFLTKTIPDRMTKMMQSIPELKRASTAKRDSPDAHVPKEHYKALHNAKGAVTKHQLDEFLHRCCNKYMRAVHHAGEAVGIVAAQSIGEPATQMTLKTFHFAGVASMNVTLGVPRIRELIDAVRNISTPLITAKLDMPKDPVSARLVKTRIEKTMLKDICVYFKEVFLNVNQDDVWKQRILQLEDIYRRQNARGPEGQQVEKAFKVEKPGFYREHGGGLFLQIKICLETLRKLQLEVSIYDIEAAIRLQVSKYKYDLCVVPNSKSKLRLYPINPQAGHSYYDLQMIRQQLPNVIIEGLKTCHRAVINSDKDLNHELLVEGTGLREVMVTPGVNGVKTLSNNVLEIREVLGIEAARAVITSEIKNTMGAHGLEVDNRHTQLLGDMMTNMGEVYGITRHGIQKLRASTFMLASFEKTTDHLFDAAAYKRRDSVAGVSDCIILGAPVNLGTGLFDLLYDPVNKKTPSSNFVKTSSAPPRRPILSTLGKSNHSRLKRQKL